MSPYQYVTLDLTDKVAVITVTREDALNALNQRVIRELREAFDEVLIRGARAVIVTGAGRSFIAGADIAEMRDLAGCEGRDYTKIGQDLMDYVEQFRIPVIAAINGFALGGGCEFAMSCDIRLASDKAKFGQPETGLGITPGYGGTCRLPKLVGKGMAKYLILSGEIIDAKEALRIGLVQRVFSPERLIAEAKKLAETITSKAPIATDAAKCAINTACDVDGRSAIAYEREAYQTSFNSQDRIEGMGAFLEKRKPLFSGR